MRGPEKAMTEIALQSTEHLVIGGGLAGAMAGLQLAAAGLEVTILERERTAHHKVCGEFLSREAVGYLERSGIDLLALGAQPINRVRLTARQHVAQAKLPFGALSLSRHLLDEALLAQAARAGCNVVRGAFVDSLNARDAGWRAQLRGGAEWSGRTVLLANGKHDLRGLDRKNAPHPDLVGFKMHWRLAAAETEALRGFIELYLFPGGYGGLSLVEGDAANLCFVVRQATLRRLGGWTELLEMIQEESATAARRLSGATALWDKPLAVSSIPYGYLAGRPQGLWCLGDQAAVIPSFTGDGMSIALHSAALAAQMCVAGRTAEEFHRELRGQLHRRMRLATGMSRALVTGVGRRLAPLGLSVLPQAMAWIARSTRIPENALRQTQHGLSRRASSIPI
jgi:flavin-dependent dehydrogenase